MYSKLTKENDSFMILIIHVFSSRHGYHKFGNIFDLLSKIVSTKICHCQPHSVFPRQSHQPDGCEFFQFLVTVRCPWKCK